VFECSDLTRPSKHIQQFASPLGLECLDEALTFTVGGPAVHRDLHDSGAAASGVAPETDCECRKALGGLVTL
jgi:hypothetical protein